MWKGSVTPRTPSCVPTAVSAVLIAARWASVNADPSAVWNTTVPLPPLAAGSADFSWSVTWAVAVPGMETADDSVPWPTAYAPPAPASSATHRTTTSRARRAQNRPSR